MGFDKAVGKVADAVSDVSDGITDRKKIADLGLEGQRKLNYLGEISGSFFKSGARPTALWLVVAGMGYALIAYPFLVWISLIFEFPKPPNLDLNTLIMLFGSLMGLSYSRHADRKNKLKFWKK